MEPDNKTAATTIEMASDLFLAESIEMGLRILPKNYSRIENRVNKKFPNVKKGGV